MEATIKNVLFCFSFKEITFCSKDAFVKSSAKRQKTVTLMQKVVIERTVLIQRTIVEEHGFNTGGGGKEGGFHTKGGGGEDGSGGGIIYSTGTSKK